ncbi:sensor histidine kinase [Gelidibacter salicanalis]|uniref:histidine kinase n=1 Tax=Gelidibacter salicanalis TaxID=291193 RepID=A0A934KHH5_9FLAO|nr:PAS domain-containing sensor histidine kinase [Gelidibacter salicanalis]MBJ7879621.1 GHKL domain-containing protein [Gelidibacter salicanalis]
MASKNLYYNIIIRVLFITAIAFGVAYLGLNKHIDYAIYLAIFLTFQVVGLINFINRMNKKIAFFFNAVENDDSTIHFPIDTKNKSVRDLHKSLNRLNFLIQKIKIENRQQEHYYHSILEQAAVGFLTLNEKGHILLANKTAKKLFNYDSLTHIQQLKRVDEKLFKLISQLKPFDQKLTSITNERETVQLTIRSKPITVGNENLILIIIQNINYELDENETDSWIKLFRVLTHEIMNSIAPITSLSETLSHIFENENTKKTPSGLNETDVSNLIKGLDIIKEQGKDLITFVESYRTLTKISKPEKEIISTATLFNKIRILSSQEVGFQKIKFEIAIQSNNLEIYADEKQMIQVLLNLVKNAIQSIHKTGKEGIIKLIAEKEKNSYNTIIHVVDNGPGISPEILNQIFIPFFTTKEDGTGIGLSLSKHIMRLHGGTLSVNSIIGKKTSFSLRF